MGRWSAYDRDGGCCGDLERITEPWLLLYVFTFLDLPTLFKLRSVCTSWYDAVLSPAFVHLYKPPTDDPWAVLRVRTSLPQNWYRELQYDDEHFDNDIKLENHTELWRPGYSQPKNCSLPIGPPGSCCVGLCSSNGLVCGMLMEHRKSVTLTVGNPITNVWKTLPPLPELHFPETVHPAYLDIFMETDASSGSSYSIAVLYRKLADEDGNRVYVLQYESHLRSWRTGPFFSTSHSLGSPIRGSAFYYTGLNTYPAYDLRSETWSHIVQDPPRVLNEQDEQYTDWASWHFVYVGAFMYKGKYHWTSLLFDPDPEQGREDIGFAIWEMKQDRLTWGLVSRILCRERFQLNCGLKTGNRDLVVRLVRDTVFISAFYRMDSHGLWPPVAFDFTLSKWFTCCMERSVNGEEDFECSYVLLPSLTATP